MSKKDALKIYREAVRSVKIKNLIKKIKWKNNILKVNNVKINAKKTHLFATGKASNEFVREFTKRFKSKVLGGVAIGLKREKIGCVKILKGDHPLPGKNTINATKELLNYAQKLRKDDFYIFFISGGSSAMFEKPIKGISLDEIREATDVLMKKGANIDELNTVRKYLSCVKGGKLANVIKAKGIALVLSDVIGNKLDVIGSGPLHGDKSKVRDAVRILKKYGLKTIAKKIKKLKDNPTRTDVKHIILGDNTIMLNKARDVAKKLGYKPIVLTNSMRGEAREIAKLIVSIAEYRKETCFLLAGETTVTVKGKGRGGRCLEMALSALKELKEGMVFLAGSSDGKDGKSKYAGAVVDWKDRIDEDKYLKKNDSERGIELLNAGIPAKPTGTNVMDLVVLLKKKVKGRGSKR